MELNTLKKQSVEKTKRKLQLNNNYEMCIDYLIINLYKSSKKLGN